MIKDILDDLRELRDEMVQKNWPAQRLSNIILKYEMKQPKETMACLLYTSPSPRDQRGSRLPGCG